MPRSYQLTWEPGPRRWRVRYKKKTHTISCKALRTPETKESSYRAANTWWLARKAEIDAAEVPVEHVHARTLDALGPRLAWARRHGDERLVSAITDDMEMLEGDRTGELRGMMFLGTEVGQAVWLDRLDQESPEVVPAGQTVGAQVAAWLDLLRQRAEAGKISADRFDNLRCHLGRFSGFVGPGLPTTAIDESRLEGYFLHLLGLVKGGQIAEATADSVFKAAKGFVRYLHERRVIDLPRNLGSRALSFGGAAKKVETFTAEQVRALAASATGQLKLHVLLALNCGMYPSDIADMKDEEVDWEAGTVTRRRSKTGDKERVPTVTFHLWPATFDLLKRWRTGGETVLRTRSGGLWAFRVMREGKLHKNDNIGPRFLELRDRLGLELAFKHLRKTSASLLNRKYDQRVVTHFLGQAPQGIAARHYIAPDEITFAGALRWLGQQYGEEVAG
jgi:integrase